MQQALLGNCLEEAITAISELDRDGCKHYLKHLDRQWADFTDEYLDDMSVERLRHVTLAAWLAVNRSTRRSA
jgi:hypothetical protein